MNGQMKKINKLSGVLDEIFGKDQDQ